MNQPVNPLSETVTHLAEDARALLAATADVAGEKVGDARKRLLAALESGKIMAARVRDQAVAGAHAADAAVRSHPYQAVVLGVGVGVLAGYLIARRGSRPS
jgi:ElaB/YqjD/DUF883 family membrane-anchored ribosome-binding protein